MNQPFELQGHRGARDLFPENTIEGFRATRALGITSLELDVGITADGMAVVNHDVRLNPDIARGPDGAWIEAPGPLIRDLTRDALLAYDVGRLRPGSPTALRHPRQRAVPGARIPTLAEVFAAVPDALIDAELKTLPREPGATVAPEVMAAAVLDVAAAAGAIPRRLRVRSFDWRGLAHVRRLRPDVELAWLTDTGFEPEQVLAAAGPGAIWAARHDDLTEEKVRRARGLGLSVRPWTVNDPRRAAELVGWGIAGLCTDAPDALAGVVQGG